MARISEDREDLLRDATAYIDRVQLELCVDDGSVELFAGIRACGAVSCYFNQDPVYHFNSTSKLRRAFVDGKLVKAESGSLIVWTRQCTENEVAMMRSQMTDDAQQEFCIKASQRLANLQQAILIRAFNVVGEICSKPESSVIDALIAFLNRMNTIEIADTPRVNG